MKDLNQSELYNELLFIAYDNELIQRTPSSTLKQLIKEQYRYEKKLENFHSEIYTSLGTIKKYTNKVEDVEKENSNVSFSINHSLEVRLKSFLRPETANLSTIPQTHYALFVICLTRLKELSTEWNSDNAIKKWNKVNTLNTNDIEETLHTMYRDKIFSLPPYGILEKIYNIYISKIFPENLFQFLLEYQQQIYLQHSFITSQWLLEFIPEIISRISFSAPSTTNYFFAFVHDLYHAICINDAKALELISNKYGIDTMDLTIPAMLSEEANNLEKLEKQIYASITPLSFEELEEKCLQITSP